MQVSREPALLPATVDPSQEPAHQMLTRNQAFFSWSCPCAPASHSKAVTPVCPHTGVWPWAMGWVVSLQNQMEVDCARTVEGPAPTH